MSFIEYTISLMVTMECLVYSCLYRHLVLCGDKTDLERANSMSTGYLGSI